MPGDVYFGLPDRVRSLLAQLLGVQAEEIALTTGASAGLAALAAGLDWKPGDEIVLAEGEFPAHFASFAPLAERWQVQLKRVRPRGRFLAGAELAEAVGPRTRLVSASLVRFHDGTRLEVEELAEACRRTGAWLVLDVSQCAGALPLDAATLGANALGARIRFARPFALPARTRCAALGCSGDGQPEPGGLGGVARVFAARGSGDGVGAQSGAARGAHCAPAGGPLRAGQPARAGPPRPLCRRGRAQPGADAAALRAARRGQHSREPARGRAAHRPASVHHCGRHRAADSRAFHLRSR